jgi:outer membrane protein TolC
VQLQYATLETRLRNSNPQLFADDARVRAAEKNRDLVLRNRYPDITVGVSPIQYGKAVREWELMLEMNIPLQQDTRRAQERESERMLSAATARREATRNRLLGELGESLANIELALQSERLATGSLLPQAEITFQSALAGYENGKVDFATLLDAQRQIRQARLGQYKAQAEARMAIIEVEKLLGEAL